MISAWQVYLVMQLDGIRGLLMATSATSIIAYIIIFFIHLTIDKESTIKILKRYWWVPLVVSITAVAMPNSKTAAAMMVLPAITSDKVIDTITPEAKEIYDLAKDALKSLSKYECSISK